MFFDVFIFVTFAGHNCCREEDVFVNKLAEA